METGSSRGNAGWVSMPGHVVRRTALLEEMTGHRERMRGIGGQCWWLDVCNASYFQG